MLTAEKSPLRSPCTTAGADGLSPAHRGALNDEDVARIDVAHRLPIHVSDAFVAEIIRPYRPHARYLKSAGITHLRARTQAPREGQEPSLVIGQGRFSIPESCYIDSTGHFNAVEFNICFNQLAYVVVGKCVEAGLFGRVLPEKANFPSFVDFKRHQLPSMLIARIEGVRFLKQMRSDDFRGVLSIDKMTSMGPAWFCFTSITFADYEGVKAKGSVVLAFSPTFGSVKN
jgi:hypothetical protein